MQEIRLVFLGFGSVNIALVEMLLDKSEIHHHRRCLRVQQSAEVEFIPWRIVTIVTGQHGTVCIPTVDNSDTCAGTWYEVDARKALRRIASNGMMDKSLVVDHTGADATLASQVQETDTSNVNGPTQQTIQLLRYLAKTKTANIVVEAIPSNPRGGGGEPAVSFIRTSLEKGMHVVSANKGPLAQQQSGAGGIEETYWSLQQIASANKVHYFHESSVMDGVPIFSLWRTMPNATLLKLRGCLNSTSTTILSRMEGPDGETFEQALGKAKEMGIVETDESLDIDGYDAAVKLRALLVVLSTPRYSSDKHILVPPIDDIPRDTLRNITKEDIQRAHASNTKYRLVATAELIDTMDKAYAKEWKAKVELEQISPIDPIYNLTGASSSVQFYTDVLGPITLVSTDPTLVDTAYGLFSDIVRVVNHAY